MARGEYSAEIQQEKMQDAQEQLDQYVKSDRIQKSIAGTKLFINQRVVKLFLVHVDCGINNHTIQLVCLIIIA